MMLVAVGGSLGALSRYGVGLAAAWLLGRGFPWGTLAVNLAGSFLIGLVQSLATEGLVLGEDARLFLTSGVMGGLTTYSAFSYESVRLVEHGAWTSASLNVVLTTAACLALCYLGLLTGRIAMASR